MTFAAKRRPWGLGGRRSAALGFCRRNNSLAMIELTRGRPRQRDWLGPSPGGQDLRGSPPALWAIDTADCSGPVLQYSGTMEQLPVTKWAKRCNYVTFRKPSEILGGGGLRSDVDRRIRSGPVLQYSGTMEQLPVTKRAKRCNYVTFHEPSENLGGAGFPKSIARSSIQWYEGALPVTKRAKRCNYVTFRRIFFFSENFGRSGSEDVDRSQ